MGRTTVMSGEEEKGERGGMEGKENKEEGEIRTREGEGGTRKRRKEEKRRRRGGGQMRGKRGKYLGEGAGGGKRRRIGREG